MIFIFLGNRVQMKSTHIVNGLFTLSQESFRLRRDAIIKNHVCSLLLLLLLISKKIRLIRGGMFPHQKSIHAQEHSRCETRRQ